MTDFIIFSNCPEIEIVQAIEPSLHLKTLAPSAAPLQWSSLDLRLNKTGDRVPPTYSSCLQRHATLGIAGHDTCNVSCAAPKAMPELLPVVSQPHVFADHT